MGNVNQRENDYNVSMKNKKRLIIDQLNESSILVLKKKARVK